MSVTDGAGRATREDGRSVEKRVRVDLPRVLPKDLVTTQGRHRRISLAARRPATGRVPLIGADFSKTAHSVVRLGCNGRHGRRYRGGQR